MPIAVETGPARYRIDSPLIVNEHDGSPMVLVPTGEFEMGDGENDNCPKHRVHLDAYYIGIYCVTNRQYKMFVDDTDHRPPSPQNVFDAAVWQGNTYPEAYADHPVVCVSWDDALTYASWAGCRLPREAEWEKAARGQQGYRYPWGNEWDESKCRNKKNLGTCPVWAYPEGVSGYGTYNQSGNVWEWCSDRYDEEYYYNSPYENPKGPKRGFGLVFRGGGWSEGDPSYFRCARRMGYDSGYRLDYRGFRLVRAV